MTQSKHTPGPWKAVPEGSGSWTIYPVDGPRDGIVTSFGQYRDRENKEADARLIAAAPDLLEALKGYIALRDQKLAIKYSDENTSEVEKAAIRKVVADNIIALLAHDDKARTALAKAEGR